MNLADRAIIDAKAILNGEFSRELTITPTGLEPVIVKGIAAKHSESFDGQGMPIIGISAHCTFTEKDLNDLGIITRNSQGQITIQDWLISWTDAIDTVKYRISRPEPDETLGTVRCTLELRK